MKVVKVYGALRELLGQCRFELDVVTPSQAVKALCVNFPQLERWLLDSEKHGVAYRVMVGKQKATAEDVSPLLLPFGEREVFSITPVVAGAGGGGGVGQILLGVAIIGLSFGIGAIASAGVALGGLAGIGTVGTAFVGIGASLVLGGVAQLLAPTPGPPKFEEAQQLESFSFSGIVNTARQGVPVPIVLGRAYAGSVVISTGLDVVQ
jgi:predicted phage tail protein